MRQEQAYQESAAAWRHAGHGVLLVCAVLLTATGTAYGETPRQEVDAALPPESETLQFVAQSDSKPASRDSLFGDDKPADASPAAPATDKPPPGSAWKGFIQGEVARSYHDPAHWSKERLRLELNRQGQFSENVKWKIGGRFDYDAAYDSSSFYAPDVRRDQRSEFSLRENYLDISSGGNWEFRLGRQHVVWGEMVGLFIADVVSARDMREFILPEPDLQALRIPQWAARAEYFMKDMKAELLWIPVPSFDLIGKPGIPGSGEPRGPTSIPIPSRDRAAPCLWAKITRPAGSPIRTTECACRRSRMAGTSRAFIITALMPRRPFTGRFCPDQRRCSSIRHGTT